LAVAFVCLGARPSFAFSMLAHQEIVDRAWQREIQPLLERRFPGATPDELREARSYAYGGAVVADIGYFPFGDKRFSELLHYVRSGDFAAALLRGAKDRNGYAFALGHLAHYAADSVGHPQATNRAVAELFPKLAAKHGPLVTYADSARAHLQTEFRFDVLEVARLGPSRERFHDAIGFHVHKELLEQAFRETYGLELGDVFESTDLAIGTFRFGMRAFLREVTNTAWHLYENDLKSKDPNLTLDGFLFDVSVDDFRKTWGSVYREPSYFGRVVAFFTTAFRLIPGVGWFERQVFQPLPGDVIALFERALDDSSKRYAELVKVPKLPNVDLDTGKSTERGEYSLADEAYAEWLHQLAEKRFATTSPEIRDELLRFYRDLS